MEGKFNVHFVDGTLEEVSAANADRAKGIAKNKRIQALDPAGQKNRADVLSHASVKVARIVELAASVVLALLVYPALLLLGSLDAAVAARLPESLHAGVLDIMAAQGTAIGATIAALAAVTNDSLVVPSFTEGKKAWLLNFWTDVQVAGTVRLRSGKWHDNTQGIRYDTIISELTPYLAPGTKQALQTGDTINVDLGGSAVAGDIEYVVLIRWFEELSAQHSNLITYEQLLARAANIMTGENTIATGTTAAWAGGEAINAELDMFVARKQYALVGYTVDTECAAVAWRGHDTANVRVGGPGDETQRDLTRSWFADLARAHNMPLIPVISADNKASTIIEALQDENGADTTVNYQLVELKAA